MKHTAIRYSKIKLCDDIFLLMPKGLVEGELDEEGGYFTTPSEVFTYYTNPILDGKYIIGNAITDDELMDLFEVEKSELEIAKGVYFEDKYDELIIIRDGKKVSFKANELFDDTDIEKTLYSVIDGEDAVVLNDKIIDTIMSLGDVDSIKNVLESYKVYIERFQKEKKGRGVQSIYIENGAIKNIEVNLQTNTLGNSNVTSNVSFTKNGDISLEGLEKYLKERIVGHDEELEDISTILVSNYYATPEDGTESILIPGPTGTGKTATMEVAAEYLGLPYANVNTVNIVPQGIVGTSLEDVLLSLIDSCNGKKELYSKAIITFDEFDKVAKDQMDLRDSIKKILLKFIEGSVFPITSQQNGNYTFDTTMLSKVFLGAFTEAFENKYHSNPIGFNSSITQSNPSKDFDINLLYKYGYFDRELITRIQHVIPYYELTDEDKYHVILDSKLSTFMKKKKRFEREYGITITGEEEFARALVEKLNKEDKSVRDLNNMIAKLLLAPQREIIKNLGKYKVLQLDGDTPITKKFNLI